MCRLSGLGNGQPRGRTAHLDYDSSIVKYIKIYHDSACTKIVKTDKKGIKNRELKHLFTKGFNIPQCCRDIIEIIFLIKIS